MAEFERKTKDLWIGSTVNPAIVKGGLTAGDEGANGNLWLTLHVNQAQIDEIENIFKDDIVAARAKVETIRQKKLMELGGPTIPGAQDEANASCTYRNWFKALVIDGAIVPGVFEVKVSQSSPNSQLKRNFKSIIRVKYYNVLDGKAQLFGTPSDPIGVAIPLESKVAVRVNTQVSVSPGEKGVGLSLSRMAQVFVYEWGTEFGGGGTDSAPEGIEIAASETAAEIPAHVLAAMANAPKAKAPTTGTDQPSAQGNAPADNPYGVNQTPAQNVYTPQAEQPAVAADNPYGAQPAAQTPATDNPYGAVQQVVDPEIERQKLFESEKLKFPTLTQEQFDTVHPRQ